MAKNGLFVGLLPRDAYVNPCGLSVPYPSIDGACERTGYLHGSSVDILIFVYRHTRECMTNTN